MAEETTLVSIDSIIGRIQEIGPIRQRASGASGRCAGDDTGERASACRVGGRRAADRERRPHPIDARSRTPLLSNVKNGSCQN